MKSFLEPTKDARAAAIQALLDGRYGPRLLVPDQDVARGAIDLAHWSGMTAPIRGGAAASAQAPVLPDVAVVAGSLEQQYVEGSNGGGGTRRNYAFANIEPTRTVRLGFTTLLHDGWTWGGHGGQPGDTPQEGGKLGLGLGGGTRPTGGQLDPGGFTVRPVWGGEKLELYYYGADQQNQAFGDDLHIGFRMPIGRSFRFEIEVTTNSSTADSDGSIRARADGRPWQTIRTGMQMMSSGTPLVDTLIYSSFFGGSSGAWEPDGTATATFSDITVLRGAVV